MAAAFLFGPGAARAQAATELTRSVTILHTNDFHGRHTAFEVMPGNATAQTGDPGRDPVTFDRAKRIGGFPALAAAIGERRSHLGPDNVLLVDGGDAFADDLLGNLTRGEAIVRLMNAAGYQFMALGNHDFDYGFERTRALSGIAKFPMRGANVIERATGKPVFGEPTIVSTVAGVKVGLLALGYHNTHLTGDRDNVRALDFTSGIEAAKRLVPELKARSEIVVIVSHQGAKVDRKLLKEVEGIDLVIGAHSHDLITPPERVGAGWLTQVMADGAMLGEVTLTVRNGRVATVAGTVHPIWADRFREDPEVAALLEKLRTPHRRELGAIIATAGERIGRRYKSESPFDKLAGRILREETGADAAFLPGVGYGVSLNPGPITREALSALLPHPSKVVTLTLSGAEIREILEQSATNQAPDDPLKAVGGLVQTDGLIWSADLRRPQGQRIGAVRTGTGSLDLKRRYRVATHAGMLGGVHNYDSFAHGEDVQEHEQAVSELVEAAFRRIGTIKAPSLGDIEIRKPD